MPKIATITLHQGKPRPSGGLTVSDASLWLEVHGKLYRCEYASSHKVLDLMIEAVTNGMPEPDHE
ncbi:MAG: hypothetical protein KC503_17510 [Myxococcales bacterium]|nr:hypothetical protein [Myxococcales bacterium]